jgi:hypothetical protein
MSTFVSAASSTVVAGAQLTLTDWWLKDPIDPTRNMAVDIRGDDFQQNSSTQQAEYHPLGSKYPIIVSDVVGAEEFFLHFEFTSKAAYLAFEVLRTSQRTLLLQRTYTGDQWYIRFAAKRTLIMTAHNPPLWRVDIEAREVYY